MTNTQRKLLFAGVLGALFVAGSFLQSRGSQAKGAYSTPVQIMNTSSSPAIAVDAEKLARIPYQSSRFSNSCTGLTGCLLTFAPPPSGYRLVVQHVSGNLWQYPLVSGTQQPAWFYVDVGLTSVLSVPSTVGQSTDGSIMQSVINSDVLTYIDSGSAVNGFAMGNWQPGFPVSVTLSGYLENCAVTGCPAVIN